MCCGNFSGVLIRAFLALVRLRVHLRARLSREIITSIHRILSSREAANRVLFFTVFSLSGSSTSDVECDYRG